MLYLLICFVRGPPHYIVSFGHVLWFVALFIKRGEILFRESGKESTGPHHYKPTRSGLKDEKYLILIVEGLNLSGLEVEELFLNYP